jgi:hypothetical protein
MPQSEPAPVTLFAPLRIDRDRPVSDLDRFQALALPSFERHLSRRLVHEVVVVVPPADVKRATSELRSTFPLRVIDENRLGADVKGTAGWIRQQILKLAAPATVTTPWLITIDADVVSTRPVDEHFVLPGGRGIWEQEAAGNHMEWWRSSARLLGVPLTVGIETPAFGVTPALLNTEALRGLWSAIESAHPGTSWSRALADRADWGWTEYTLYWTHLLGAGQADRLYSAVARYPYALAGSVWTRNGIDGFDEAALDQVFARDADHAFAVFQSALELPLEFVVRRLRPHLGLEEHPSPQELRRWARHRRRWKFRTLRRRGRALIGSGLRR